MDGAYVGMSRAATAPSTASKHSFYFFCMYGVWCVHMHTRGDPRLMSRFFLIVLHLLC